MASTRQKNMSYQTGEYQKTNKTSAIRSFISKRAQANTSPSRPIFDLASASRTNSPTKSENRPLSTYTPPCLSVPLGEIGSNKQKYAPSPSPSPTKSKGLSRPDIFKARSVVSLKTLSREHESRKENADPAGDVEIGSSPPKKQRSSANLALQNILSRPKSAKNLRKQAEIEEAARLAKEREEVERVEAAAAAEAALNRRPPIFAQFSSDYFTKQALGGKFLESPVDDDDHVYPPLPDSPTKENGSFDWDSPSRSLSPSKQSSIKRKSTYLLMGEDEFVLSNIGRQDSRASQRSKMPPPEDRTDLIVRQSSGASHRARQQQKPTEMIDDIHQSSIVLQRARQHEKSDDTNHNRQSRSLSPKKSDLSLETRTARWKASRPPSISPSKSSRNSRILAEVNVKDVEAALEELLDRRNIPEDQRHKMRDVALVVKLDLIKHERKEAEERELKLLSEDVSHDNLVTDRTSTHPSPELKKRPRSRTFTLSRSSKHNSSPTKKVKPESSRHLGHHSRTKSSDSLIKPVKLFSDSTSTSTAFESFLSRGTRLTTPEDFVKYFQKETRPDKIDVRKVQKLKQLLRNEKIDWTDEFIFLDGMKEVIGLLHRIMEVEWRDEHEDSLLHETLLCLKALCTTTLAQTYLEKVHTTLFRALTKMLFDPEHKGPAEFSTRHLITNLLFTYLKSCPLNDRHIRAEQILGYLRDEVKAPEERPVDFIEAIHIPRPYKSWCREMYGVAKEVFWIFCHGLNVVSLPSTKVDDGDSSPTRITIPEYAYMSMHFPAEAPPRPAAPHVGSVEWDATNYLTSHLNLLNGIIASLPTMEERNNLRANLRRCGMERCLGDEMRRCKEVYYPTLHEALRCWVAAATADGWNTRDVRCGGDMKRVILKQGGRKKKEEAPPKLDLAFDFMGDGRDGGKGLVGDDPDLGTRDLIGRREKEETELE